MALVQPNDPMKAMMLKDSISDVTNRLEDVVISFFNGPMPTKANLVDNLVYTSDGWANVNSILPYVVTTLGNTELLRVEYNNFGFREQIGLTKMRFNLSKRPETFDGRADGTAQWFIMFEQDETTAYSSAAMRWGMVGTLGLIGSGADMEIDDLDILTTKRYRMNDVIADFNIQGSNT